VKRGRVVGQVWATRKHPALAARKLLLVEPHCATGGDGSIIVAFDAVDAGPGDEVLVSPGSGARRAFVKHDDRALLCDAAVTLVVDGREGDGDVPR